MADAYSEMRDRALRRTASEIRRSLNLPSPPPSPTLDENVRPADLGIPAIYLDSNGDILPAWRRTPIEVLKTAPPFRSWGPHRPEDAAGPARTVTAIRSTRNASNSASTSALAAAPAPAPQIARAPRILQPAPQPVEAVPPPPPPPPFEGYRVPRLHPLTERSLYNDAARPPILASPKPHHVCGICLSVKSHPVSYPCGHGHCYVCIRLWLEKAWTCPQCTQQMYMPPFRHYGEEDSITFDYPFWVDDSRVSYSFDGLDFPAAPPRRIVLDLTDAP
ncbi:hypothetical protein R3P38DRAFT_3173739 [Favolaschia claudopus]|uniref:RING-type domain-containing protein n=1 Tax=Favolaschia claudopus TaxID=2862362 RepID=A0AAW0DGH4_9AGAR